MLSIAKPRHPVVHILIHIAVYFPSFEFPRPPSQALLPTLLGQKAGDDQDERLGMNIVTNWVLGAREHQPSFSGGCGRNG